MKEEVIYRNLSLEAYKYLKAEKVIRQYDFYWDAEKGRRKKKVINEKSETITYKLEYIDSSELDSLRKKLIPIFILKIGNNCYYTQVPKEFDVYNYKLIGPHKCGQNCCRLSAASDEDGGCEKVRNRATCIERYSWITFGYETVNVNNESFIVINCDNYKKSMPRIKVETSTRSPNYIESMIAEKYKNSRAQRVNN